ncbi:MAG TPA: hypothetical protein VES88_00035 [Gemmatimonadaceae bacterium]|nr:hypothetical protein [Gemmatimonadaceae bacterium]
MKRTLSIPTFAPIFAAGGVRTYQRGLGDRATTSQAFAAGRHLAPAAPRRRICSRARVQKQHFPDTKPALRQLVASVKWILHKWLNAPLLIKMKTDHFVPPLAT